MTENEAVEELKENIELPFGSDISDKASRMAMKALEEIQQYREIGTVEECREARKRQRVKKPGRNEAILVDYIISRIHSCPFEDDCGIDFEKECVGLGAPGCRECILTNIDKLEEDK